MSVRVDEATERWTAGQTQAPAVTPRALLPGHLLAERYQIEAALGQGGMAVVYRARDRQSDQPVAIKAFFPPPGLDEGPLRFQREFRALTRLQHPHIVRVLDYGEADGVPFYAMEFIAGADLSAVRHARGGRLPLHDVSAIGIQLCDALAYIHAQGIVHRDLKPSNVMVENLNSQLPTPHPRRAQSAPREAGSGTYSQLPISNIQLPTSDLQIKLVDFGLAKLSNLSASLTASGALLGTINYMSPEQLQGLPVDPRSDLYSLGVLLYELALGRMPFTADTITAVMFQHLSQTPAPLRGFDASIPSEFDNLVLALLAKRPSERPPSAEVVHKRLSNLNSLSATASIVLTTAPRADAVFRAGLIGRRDELTHLNQQLDEAWAGAGRLILIEGEAGVGKTRLANELAGQAYLRGGQRLLSSCHESEYLPYGPVAEWLAEALRHTENIQDIFVGLENELARLVPRLLPTSAASPDAQLDPQQARLRFFDAVLRALVRLSERKPLLLLLDDMQWADEASLELLHYLVRNARGQRICICATARREDIIGAELNSAPTGALSSLLRDLNRLRLFERIELERLSSQATAELIAALLGLDETPSNLAERIYRESEGNPFFIEELLKALAEEGLLARQNGRWRLQADASVTMLRIPSSIVEVIQRRLARLSDGDRSALNWAAVLGHEFTYELLQRASSINEDVLLDALDNLLRSQLIGEVRDPRADKYHFTHAKVREVVCADLSVARRKFMHRTVGATIEKNYAARLAEMSPILAHHFRQGGENAKAAHYSALAGEGARRVYANQEAIAFYQQAIELGAADTAQLVAAHRGLGEVYYLIGEYARATEHFRALIELAPQSERSEAWRWLGQTYEARGDYAEALRCYEQGLNALAPSDGAGRARLLNEMAWVYMRQGNYPRAHAYCEQAIELAGAYSDIVATAYGYLGDTAKLQGDHDQAADYYLKSLSLWERIGNKSRVARELNNLGRMAKAKEAYDQAINYYQKSLTICQEIGLSLGTAYVLNNLGTIYLHRGDQADLAHKYFQQSLDIFQRIGSKDGIAMAYNNLAENCIALNETEQAMSYLLQAETINGEQGDKARLAYTFMLMAKVRLTEQCLSEAEDYARRALQMADETGMKLYAATTHRLLGQIHIRASRMNEARDHLSKACAIFDSIDQPAEMQRTRELLEQIDELKS